MTVPFREATIDMDAVADNTRHLRRLTGVDVIAVVKANAYGHGAAASAVAASREARTASASPTSPKRSSCAAPGSPPPSSLREPGQRFDAAAENRIEIGISSFDQLEAAGSVAGRRRRRAPQTRRNRASRATASPRATGRGSSPKPRASNASATSASSACSATSPTPRPSKTAPAFTDRRRDGGCGIRRHPTRDPTLRRHGRRDRPADATRRRARRHRYLRTLAVRRSIIRRARAAPRDDPARCGRRRAPRARRRGRLVRLRPPHHRDTDPPRSCRSGTPTGCRVRHPAADPVTIGGRRYSIAGRVAMDQFVVDVGDDHVAVAVEVVLFGDPTLGAPAATDWANAAGTINYEIVTRIGNRVPRRNA